MAGARGGGRGRGRGRPPINRRQTEEHSHQDTEIHVNDDHLSHAETEHEEHESKDELNQLLKKYHMVNEGGMVAVGVVVVAEKFLTDHGFLLDQFPDFFPEFSICFLLSTEFPFTRNPDLIISSIFANLRYYVRYSSGELLSSHLGYIRRVVSLLGSCALS
ncbi:hypothetical protein L1987_32597 [Smallanthus sonchifolius]|uniref:Uncharacterized protein n=1 Tax=Smallanthus sonchifolius TaxID=185202 RepID=A0ACB9HPX1_9ASTR|nr:hypothetical protein L1987_32597 [Smallanthus sonchifolius]